jgi:molybdate transport system ATP-binding protein
VSLEVDIRKDLGSFRLDVHFATVESHETFALLGASGCGKSLTLRAIAGLMKPDKGRIVLNGRVLFDSKEHINVPPKDRHVGYLFQQYALFPNMTVEKNVLAGACGSTHAERLERAHAEISRMQLEGLERLKPAQLSGGQQQRLALARILAGSPEMLLLDEPFSALDGYLRWQLELELADTLKSFPGGAIFVSHSRDEVYRLADEVCVISKGHTEECAPVHEFFAHPKTLAAALISGCKNISRAEVLPDGRLSCTDWGVALETEGTAPESTTHAGIRAHYFRVAEEGAVCTNAIPCTVVRTIESPFSVICMLKTPGTAELRYELGKDEWARLGSHSALVLTCDPSSVMPLAGGAKEGAPDA